MWFKSAVIFKLTKSNYFAQLHLALLLEQHKFRECGATESSTSGWVSALPGTTNLVHGVDNDNYQLIRCCKSVKALPADFVRREVDKKVKVIETEQCRKATKKEKEQLKEEVIFANLPNAFPVHTFTEIYLDNINELIIINSSTRAAADDILALLRKCIGTLPVTGYFTDALQECLDEWVAGVRDVEAEFSLGSNVQLSAFGDSPAQAKFTNDDITAKHIKSLVVDDNREVNYLSLEFDEAFYLTLDARGFLKGIKPTDVLKDKNDDIDSDDALARIDADFVLFAKEMGRLFCAFKAMKVTDETEREVFDASTIKYPTLQELAKELEKTMGSLGVSETFEKPEKKQAEELCEEEPLLNEAKAFVIKVQRASISATQRKFRIGYNRSARIMDLLVDQGVVSEPGHNGVREVLVLEEV